MSNRGQTTIFAVPPAPTFAPRCHAWRRASAWFDPNRAFHASNDLAAVTIVARVGVAQTWPITKPFPGNDFPTRGSEPEPQKIPLLLHVTLLPCIVFHVT